MTSDYNMLRGLKTMGDYQQLQEEFELKKRLGAAEIAKATQLDADKLGEQAFLKVAQGLPLTPQEEAAARFIDAKSGGVSFNPVTGEMLQKPRISDKIGLPGMAAASGGSGGGMIDIAGTFPAIDEEDLSGNFPMPANPGPPGPPQTQAAQSNNYYDGLFQEALNNAAGNPKLQQTIKDDYLKNKMSFTDSQSSAATYADRMREAEAILSQPQISQQGMSPEQVGKDKIPLIGNFLVNDQYQQYDQARRNFINATLRRESGAVISPAEFANANRQYFPQPGDEKNPAVLEQKARNRATAIAGISRAAGPAYEPSNVQDPYAGNAGPEKGTVENGFMYLGGEPSSPKSWKRLK